MCDTFNPGPTGRTTHAVRADADTTIARYTEEQWATIAQAGVPVVDSDWLVASAKAGQLVPVGDYPATRLSPEPGTIDPPIEKQSSARAGHAPLRAPAKPRTPAGTDAQPPFVGGSSPKKGIQKSLPGDDESYPRAKKSYYIPKQVALETFGAVPPGSEPDFDELERKVRSPSATVDH